VGDRCEVYVRQCSLKIVTHVFRPTVQSHSHHGHTSANSFLNSCIEGTILRGRKNLPFCVTISVFIVFMIIMTIGLLWLLWLILHGLITTRFGLDTIFMLHLKNELAIFNISVLWHKGSLAFTIAMSGVSPSVFVQMIAFEVLFPTQLEFVFTILIAQPVVGLNIFVSGVPRHVCVRVKVTLGPFGRPEVHKDVLFLAKVMQGLIEIIFKVNFTSTFNTVDDESDMIRCPPDIILMPVVRWVEVLNLIPLVFEARPDEISGDFVMSMRNKLKIDVVPAGYRKVFLLVAEPNGHEGGNSAMLIRALHPSDEATVLELVP